MNTNWNAPPPTYDVHSTSYATTSLTPYLQLPHLLSLTWLAYPILSLLFVAFRLQLSLASSQEAIASAKDNLVASCKAAEQAATAAASMPRYMAIATNKQFADAVNGSLNAARAALVLSLTVMEVVINFIIDLYRSTLLCFLELVVRGGLAILISAVQEVTNLIENTASSLRTSIQNDIASANSGIQSAIDAINKVNPFSDITAPQISIPNLDALNNVTIPSTFEDALTRLNATLPTVAELKDKVEDVINTPFELLKKDINDTFSGISFNSSTLPVPQQNLLSFCNDLDTSVVDDLGKDLVKIAKIGVLIIILLALLLIALNCLLEWYKWRCMKSHMEYTRQAWLSDPTMHHSQPASGMPQVTLTDHNLLMLHANSSHPLLTRIVNNMSARLRLTPTQHTHMQWFFSYIFHPPALACFLIGFFGILCVQVQLLAMGPLVNKYSERSASAVSDFSNTIATSINDSMYNQSAAYANEVNGQVDAVQQTINSGLFGWVNGTTTTLNTTINTFYTDVQNAVGLVFDGTILERPAQEFIRCLIGTKVDAIENALTFLHDNLIVNMPRVNQTVLLLSPESVDEASRPIAAAAIGGGTDDDQGLIGRLVNAYAETLRKEQVMFGIFMGLWGFVVLMGLSIILWHSYGKVLVEKRRRRKWQREQKVGIDGIVIPFRLGMQPGNEKGLGNSSTGQALPSFTPLPSPKGSAFRPFGINFSRSASPENKPTHGGQSESQESLQAKPETSWDSFFGQKEGVKPTSRAITKPMKLMAIGRKTMGRERLVPDSEAARAPISSEAQESHGNTAWFGRMAAMIMIGMKHTEPEAPPRSDQMSPRNRARPNLRISIERTANVRPNLPEVYDNALDEGLAPKSRWSASPEATRTTTMSWAQSMMSPPKKNSVVLPPIGIPIRTMPRHETNVPSDVNSYEDSLAVPLKPIPFAPPLHLAFESSRTIPLARRDLSPPPIKSPRAVQPHVALAPPPGTHRRSLTVPAWKVATAKNNDTGSASVTPVTRLLTTTHARQSSSVNPFQTPFDDEHRVSMYGGFAKRDSRKSARSTNPFVQGIAL